MNLIILDRDGTLIPNDFWRNSAQQNWKYIMPINHRLIRLITENLPDSICIIITNQAGVALGLYSEERVREINKYLIEYLKEYGVTVIDHNYCPDVDLKYARETGIPVNVNYVKNFTKRKPSPVMVQEILNKHHYELKRFKSILVFGDRHEDKELAVNLKADFIGMSYDTTYYDLVKMIK